MTIPYLPDEASIHYSELMQRCVQPRSEGAGLSFVSKKIKGKTYCYLQSRVGDRRWQIYLGVDSPALREQIEREKALWSLAEEDLTIQKKLIAMYLAGGGTGLQRTEARIVGALERGGIFLAGGVLVGTQAFRSYANSLSVVWPSQIRTQDIDVAGWEKYALALPNTQVNIKELLERSDLGVFEVPALDRKNPSTTFSIGKKEYTVDVLTPEIGKPRDKPIYLPSFKTYAEPLRFLDYLLQEIEPAVLVYGAGMLVNVPNPAFFALHKCVVSQRRVAIFKTKIQKDLKQAALLIEVLHEQRPGDLILAMEAAQKMGNKFMLQMNQGIKQLPEDIQERLNDV